MDTVEVTAIDVRVLIGANSSKNLSLRDDWVAAQDASGRQNTIDDWIRLAGPVGLRLTFTVKQVTATGGSVQVQGFNPNGTSQPLGAATMNLTPTNAQLGFDQGEFFIKGGKIAEWIDYGIR